MFACAFITSVCVYGVFMFFFGVCLGVNLEVRCKFVLFDYQLQ